MTTICTEDLGRYAGVGLTLEQVIEEELRNVSAVSPGRVEESDDLVIWEANKIAALIRIGADNRPVVTRFDRPAAPDGTSVSEEGKLPATDMFDLANAGPALARWVSAVSETRAAISHFQTLRRIAEEVHQRCQEACHDGASLAPSGAEQEFWQRWRKVACDSLVISERHLCRAMDDLAAAVKNHPDRRDTGSRSHECGVILEGRLFLVQEGLPSKSLVVVDPKNVFRLDPGRGGVSIDIL